MESELKEVLAPLKTLTLKQRLVFMEYHYYRTDMKEIAKELKISSGRVYTILHKAEKALGIDKNNKIRFGKGESWNSDIYSKDLESQCKESGVVLSEPYKWSIAQGE